jgi:hypothetical protein
MIYQRTLKDNCGLRLRSVVAHRFFVVMLAFGIHAILFASSIAAQPLLEPRPASELPSLAHYRLDGQAHWRLANHEVTMEERAPTLHSPVYEQFGTVSCIPCHDLAEWIGPRLPPTVLAVYGHVDEVELVENGVSLGRMLRELNEQLNSIPAYARFLTVTNVRSEVIRELTGSSGLPGGLFILPDGRHVLFTGFRPETIEPLLIWWLGESGLIP